MPKKAKELTALEVQRLKKPGFHSVGGAAGLALQVKESGARSWVLRAVVGARRRDIGLGGYPDVPLAMAREKARQHREMIVAGVDPVEQRREARLALLATAPVMTFRQAAEGYMKAHEAGWKNLKHGQQWRNTLEAYAYPVFGDLPVGAVDLGHVMKVLEPEWSTKTETMVRVRSRIELVLDWAAVRGLRSKDNPARWRGHLDKLLAKPTKVAKREHFKALPIDAMHDFMTRLGQSEGIGAKALAFVALTAARSGEVRGATWAEVDLTGKVWTLPASRMKAAREHRVPLSDAAVTLLKALPRIAGNDLVFPAPRGGMLSDMTLSAVMRRLNVDAVPHGLRSTFRDWCAERTNYPREVAEMALAHTIGNAVEAAYRRGDLFDRRRQLMDDWAAFLARPPAPAASTVVDLGQHQQRRRAKRA